MGSETRQEDPELLYVHIEEEFVQGAGTSDYNLLYNKPTINGTTLEGEMQLADIGALTPTVENEKLIFS